ncbi:MAG: hypothetical protein GF364_00170 [Candidatus Lokiarchaeota archaeon]|nr:hypothetical protein [Candidatus Lokiarchaeota archaeon]
MDYDIEDIRNGARVSNLARLFQLLTNIFGIKSNREKLESIEGKELALGFPAWGNKYATIKVSDFLLHPSIGKPDDPASYVIIDVASEEVVPVIIDVIRTPGTIFGLTKLILKYVLRGKVKVKGNLGVALKILRCLMTGQHQMYDEEKRRDHQEHQKDQEKKLQTEADGGK